MSLLSCYRADAILACIVGIPLYYEVVAANKPAKVRILGIWALGCFRHGSIGTMRTFGRFFINVASRYVVCLFAMLTTQC